jgi:hypothetical protein
MPTYSKGKRLLVKEVQFAHRWQQVGQKQILKSVDRHHGFTTTLLLGHCQQAANKNWNPSTKAATHEETPIGQGRMCVIYYSIAV